MKLCLSMIVRNEAARIERCLASVMPWIETFAIVDTGSTDGTQQKMLDILYGAGLHGTVSERNFDDFSSSRNHALTLARTQPGEWEYILLVDADMELVVEDRGWLDGLTSEAYLLAQRSGTMTYRNTRLVHRDVPAFYIGATHEYLNIEGNNTNLDGAWFTDHADGSNRKGKFERDIFLLEADLRRDPDNHRSVFYLAQSYRDLGNHEKSAELYARRADMGGWDEEQFYARLAQSRCVREIENRS